MHHIHDLITIFNNCFAAEYNTRLVKGDDEPIYLPADSTRDYHALFFAHGFYSSALHESAHWLLAGEKRRLLVDFGYWYIPDGRSAEQQALFEQVEVKPQAIEWILSVASGFPFHISMDNLHGEVSQTDTFKSNIYKQIQHYCQHGLPSRAHRFRLALCTFYNQPQELKIQDFAITPR